jgi:hypothetical protein
MALTLIVCKIGHEYIFKVYFPLVFLFSSQKVALCGISFWLCSLLDTIFLFLLKTFCLLDNINISKLNFSPSLFSKCHISLYYIVHVLYIKLSMWRDRERRSSSEYHTPFCIFAGQKTFDKSAALSCVAFSYLPLQPHSPSRRRRGWLTFRRTFPIFHCSSSSNEKKRESLGACGNEGPKAGWGMCRNVLTR